MRQLLVCGMIDPDREALQRRSLRQGADMNAVILGMVGLVCAIAWLTLLVVTDFSPLPVGAGLLMVLWISGSPPDRKRTSTRW